MLIERIVCPHVRVDAPRMLHAFLASAANRANKTLVSRRQLFEAEVFFVEPDPVGRRDACGKTIELR